MSPLLLKKAIAGCLAGMLMAPVSQAFAAPGPPPQNGSPAQSAAPASGTAEPAQAATGQNPSNAAQTTPAQQPPNRPVGTAVAPYEGTSGVTGSRPAGAVIAPAKQRRVRAIFIKIAVVVGAAAAVGTVVALSHASPSQPH